MGRRPTPALPDPRSERQRLESSRMSLGDHLQELRGMLIRVVAAIVIAMLLCMLFGGTILSVLCMPLATALRFNGLPVTVRTLAPSESFITYLNVSLAAGVFLASPYVLHQLWKFVASGLYEREQRVLTRYFPMSVGLFLAGALFFFFVIGPICLSFFIGFGRDYSPPMLPTPILGTPPAAISAPPAPTQGAAPPAALKLPILPDGPAEPSEGDLWLDPRDATVRIWLGGRSRTLVQTPPEEGGLVSPEITLSNYMSFISSLTLVFAAAFETPLVVLALAKLGLVTPALLRRYRRHVVVVVLIAAMVVTPPDVFSQVALAVPVYLLFELGVLLAARQGRPTPPKATK